MFHCSIFIHVYIYKVYLPYLLSFTLSIYPSPLPTDNHPWTGPILCSWPSFLFVYIDCSRGFCCGISHMYILYFNQINFLCYTLYHPAPLLFKRFQCISLFYLHTQVQCVSRVFSLHNLFSSPTSHSPL
jgi:hypothetical protein